MIQIGLGLIATFFMGGLIIVLIKAFSSKEDEENDGGIENERSRYDIGDEVSFEAEAEDIKKIKSSIYFPNKSKEKNTREVTHIEKEDGNYYRGTDERTSTGD